MMAVCSSSPFCLGMWEWTDCPGAKDSGERSEISTQSVPETSSSMAAPTDILIKVNAYASASTTRAPPTNGRLLDSSAMESLLNLAKVWLQLTLLGVQSGHQKCSSYGRMPEIKGFSEDLLMCTDPSHLNIHLTQFAVEARKASGEYYPPSSLYQLSSLQHFMPYEGNNY